MNLQNVEVKRKYHSAKEDVITTFYAPILRESTKYLRAVGYFSSQILIEYIDGLEAFVRNEGKMFLIISPSVSTVDALALLESTNPTSDFSQQLSSLFQSYKLDGIRSDQAAKILFALIRENYLEVQIAEPKSVSGIFHEKIGIFRDELGNKVAIIGSNNETGKAVTFNVESFNAFCSWKDGQNEYVVEHEMDFNDYWGGQSNDVRIHKLIDALDKNILKLFDSDDTIDCLYRQFRESKEKIKNGLNFKPRDFQKADAEKWIEAKRGIISYATGVGKTKAAIYALSKYYELFDEIFVLLVVPDKSLVNQWFSELHENKFTCVKCYSDSPNWKTDFKDHVDQWNYGKIKKVIILTTKQTFGGDSFQAQLKRIKNSFIFLADECHHLGTENLLNKLPDVEYRLGLSATPEIYLQEARTERLMNYFGGIIAEYSIAKAIDNGYLVPYEYFPIAVELTEEEKEQYDKLTSQIVKCIGYKDEKDIRNADNALELLLFKRSRIIYGATNKLDLLGDKLNSVISGGYFLIYCGASGVSQDMDDSSAEFIEIDSESSELITTQLEAVNNLLHTHGIPAAQYTQEENHFERQKELEAFRLGSLKCLVAIKCLDEGIDIPEVRTAFILASSGNPREFIQRRGRLLRNSPGKMKALIFDMIVFSPDESYRSINRVELKRLQEFASTALNAEQILKEYQEYIKEYVEVEEV